MFGVGWTEMLLIGIVALVVIGPKDLPVVMNRLGKVVATIRRMGGEFQRELNKTTGLDQITDLRRTITEPLKQTAAEITREFNKPLEGGGTAPTGIIAPKTPGAQSVVAEIHEKAGMAPPDPVQATPADPAVPAKVESPAPVEAIAPAAVPARKTRARKTAAAAAAVEVPATPSPKPRRRSAAEDTDRPAPASSRKRRTPKPKAEG